jgi:hypothetical protein
MNNDIQRKNKIITVLSIALIISLLGNIFQLFTQKTVINEKEYFVEKSDSIETRKKELEKEFNDAIGELSVYKGKSASLDSLLEEAYQKLEQQKKQIGRLIETKQDYQVLQQRYAELKKTTEMYILEIEKLTKENTELKYQNTELSVALNQTKEVNKDLKTKVDVASKLKLSSISTKSFSVKSSGKEKETDKANRTERLNIAFTIDENPLATTGNKTVYVRVIGPQGFVLADVGQGVNKFITENNTEIPYSRSLNINFDGSKYSKVASWDQDAFAPGVYKIEIYIDGALAGSDKITLY